MRRPRYANLVEKATHAAVAAIEIYNKPGFRYREETFSILMLNAWELLLKARILKENKNHLRSIEVWETRKTKSGGPSTRLFPKRTRAGNTMTIGVATAAAIVSEYSKDGVDRYAVENISLLIEIRDNAIHFHNAGRGLRKRVQEIGAIHTLTDGDMLDMRPRLTAVTFGNTDNRQIAAFAIDAL